MKNKWSAFLAAVAMAVLILDTKTALSGVTEGLEVCMQTVIPSLFPFMVVSMLLNSALAGQRIPVLRPLAKLLRIPDGAVSVFLIGLLGGYPLGAQAVAQNVRAGQLDRRDGQRMLAFCSNAGPAFIFGIGIRLLPQIWMCWLLWAIHIASALLTGILTPGHSKAAAAIQKQPALCLSKALSLAIRTLATVCGWIVLFRVLIAVLERWILWIFPQSLRIVLYGILELANGCCSLLTIDRIGVRFLLFSSMLALGGLCVAMQTYTVCNGISAVQYLPGKAVQAALSILLCQCAQPLFAAQDRYFASPLLLALCLGWICIYTLLGKKAKNKGSISHSFAI